MKLFPLAKRLGKYAVIKVQRTSAYRKLTSLFFENIHISEANESERRIVQRWWNPDYSETTLQPNPNTTDFVAKKGKKVVGYVQLVRRSEDFKHETGHWLFGLLVKPFYRNIGIGEALSRKVMEQAQGEGAKELLLLVHEDNQNAIKLYLKLGFEFKVIQGLEELLEREKSKTGRRRVVMGKLFT